jgi:hypothetical protein
MVGTLTLCPPYALAPLDAKERETLMGVLYKLR